MRILKTFVLLMVMSLTMACDSSEPQPAQEVHPSQNVAAAAAVEMADSAQTQPDAAQTPPPTQQAAAPAAEAAPE